MFKRTALLLAFSALTSAFNIPLALAQEDVSTQDIIDTLAPGAITKGIALDAPALSDEDQAFIDDLSTGTKQITVVERKKINAVVASANLPTIDLHVFFDFDSAGISENAAIDLAKLGEALTSDRLKGQKFLLAGHTDAKGPDAYNQSLSEQRANAVRAFLVENYGLGAQQLIAAGYGEENLATPDTPEAAENRRVQIVRLSQ
jgi:outer membrane protein OmpA-like peptidoglycan-associated protein